MLLGMYAIPILTGPPSATVVFFSSCVFASTGLLVLLLRNLLLLHGLWKRG
jgi:hypothetical protein